MNQFFADYISRGKSLAARENLSWHLKHDERGIVPKNLRWNISRVCNVTQGRLAWVRTLETYGPALEPFNKHRILAGLAPVEHGPMSREWIDFYLATMLCAVLDGNLKPHSALCNIGQSIRILACCCFDRMPWAITPEDIRLAYNVALEIGASGKMALNFQTMIRTVFDQRHLSDFGPMVSYCTPYNDLVSISRHKITQQRRQIENTHRKSESRKTLAEKKHPEKLPDMDAFWEMVRIVFTVKPQSFSDAVRFQLFSLIVFTGFRVGEAVRVPMQCIQIREYFDRKGRSAAEKGGISTSIQIRHFAEKQTADRNQNGIVFVESFQDVPEIFADLIREIVTRTEQLTYQMRERLRAQVESGRLFPDLAPDALVPDWDLYLRLSGNIQLGELPLPEDMVAKYRETFSRQDLDNLRTHQIQAYYRKPNRQILEYFQMWAKKADYITFRDKDGNQTTPVSGGNYTFKVSEIERYVEEHLPTKHPNLEASALSNGGAHYPHEFLFLFPTRSIIEDREGGVLDVGKYAFIGLGSEVDLNIHLGTRKPNIFSRYGKADAVDYSINPHALRHLQNDELFRAGVSDALITMRFGRRSPAQSHEYDHRTLAEDLDYMEVPEVDIDPLSPNARKAIHLISEGKVEGQIVSEFRRIQAELGDQAGFDYLNAEAGGLHVTPLNRTGFAGGPNS